MGRRVCNATFADAHTVDSAKQVWLAMDLTPLVHDPELALTDFVGAKTQAFLRTVQALLSA